MPAGFPDRFRGLAARVPIPGAARLVRMSGSSIAAPDASWWVSDFLNAAYFARSSRERDLEDLRLAFTILTTRWAAHPRRRLHVTDVAEFHRAFRRRWRRLPGPLGTLDREALLEGGAALLGDWFPEAVADPRRRAHGVAFRSVAARQAFDPTLRLRWSAVRPLSPPRGAASEQRWHTYPAVPVPDPEGAVAFLRDPSRWPDAAPEGGRFTALRHGGLRGQTFEIEINLRPAPQTPLFTRGYVTCTGLHEPGLGLERWIAELNRTVAAEAPGDPPPVPEGARPLFGAELTTHEGHFLGPAISRLLAFSDGSGAYLRDVGSWEPLPWYLAGPYVLAGQRAQEAFWGPKPEERSILAQIGRVSAGR
jgi:hypothetical protein